MKNPDREFTFGLKGQKLFVQDWGATDKPAILLIHGFPGSGDQGRLLVTTPHADDFRLISLDRPGYGRSDYQNNLTPVLFAKQIQRLADHMDLQKFRVLSVSGGAPYSMAVAATLGKRILKISSVAGVAPLTVRNFKFMNTNQRKAWLLRNLVPGPILKYGMSRIWDAGLEKVDEFLFSDLASFPKSDQIVFQHPVIGPALVDTVKKGLKPGASGVLHDMKVYSRPWGFSLRDIQCPVTLWHGTEDDVVHLRFTQDMKKNIPHAHVNQISGEGHYSLPMNFRDQILLDLLSDSKIE